MSTRAKTLRIALIQGNPIVGDIEGNSERLREAIQEARRRGAEVVVTSELAVIGYPPRDMLHREQMLRRQWEAVEALARESDEELALILGAVCRAPKGSGRQLVNGAVVCHGGQVQAQIGKRLLPTYDVFEEDRYFESMDEPGVVSWKGLKLGITICEDAWARADSEEMPDYEVDPIEEVVEAEADILINLSASPFSMGKAGFRGELLCDHCRRHGKAMVFVNQVGANDELIFDGRSAVVDGRGDLRCQLAAFEEDLEVVEVGPMGDVTVGMASTEEVESTSSDPGDLSVVDEVRQALVLGIGDYVNKSGFDGVLIGLSGGIDSSVTATLAAEALGPDRVHGVAMPSKFSSAHSREDARALGKNLGIQYSEIPIRQPYESVLETLNPHFDDPSFGVAEENVQARLRGVYLMALSNKTGKLVIAAGNKSELAVGYSTLYGDMCGALAAIGDVSKMMVYALADRYNEMAGRDVIPRRVLEKAPSAELRPDQKDEDSLPAYEVLDEILERYLVDHDSVTTIVEQGFDRAMVEEVVAMVHRNEYKRWQAPPILKVSPKAFGVGWRYPLAARYRW